MSGDDKKSRVLTVGANLRPPLVAGDVLRKTRLAQICASRGGNTSIGLSAMKSAAFFPLLQICTNGMVRAATVQANCVAESWKTRQPIQYASSSLIHLRASRNTSFGVGRGAGTDLRVASSDCLTESQRRPRTLHADSAEAPMENPIWRSGLTVAAGSRLNECKPVPASCGSRTAAPHTACEKTVQRRGSVLGSTAPVCRKSACRRHRCHASPEKPKFSVFCWLLQICKSRGQWSPLPARHAPIEVREVAIRNARRLA